MRRRAEAAAVLGCREGTVASQASRALAKLREVATTGASVPFPCDGRFVDPGTVVCAQGAEIDTYRIDGTLVARVTIGGALASDPRFPSDPPVVAFGPGR